MQSRSECFPIKEEELDSERQIFDDGIYTWLGALGAIFALDAENTIYREKTIIGRTLRARIEEGRRSGNYFGWVNLSGRGDFGPRVYLCNNSAVFSIECPIIILLSEEVTPIGKHQIASF